LELGNQKLVVKMQAVGMGKEGQLLGTAASFAEYFTAELFTGVFVSWELTLICACELSCST